LGIASAIACVALVGATAGYGATASKPVSKFKHGVEGWTVVGDPQSPTPTHIKRGGDPGGYIETTDAAQGGIMYWSAPAKFLGDQSAHYGGTLHYALRETAEGHQFNASDVILKGGATRLTYDTATNPGPAWTKYQVPLSEAGWMKGDLPATRADMLAVLSSLKVVLIRAEFASHSETDDLDTVSIKGP
jgi:hypothetical protein